MNTPPVLNVHAPEFIPSHAAAPTQSNPHPVEVEPESTQAEKSQSCTLVERSALEGIPFTSPSSPTPMEGPPYLKPQHHLDAQSDEALDFNNEEAAENIESNSEEANINSPLTDSGTQTSADSEISESLSEQLILVQKQCPLPWVALMMKDQI